MFLGQQPNSVSLLRGRRNVRHATLEMVDAECVHPLLPDRDRREPRPLRADRSTVNSELGDRAQHASGHRLARHRAPARSAQAGYRPSTMSEPPRALHTVGDNVTGSASTVDRRIGPRWTVTSTLALGLLVMTVAVWLFSDVYAALTDDRSVALLDEPTLMLAMEIRSPWLDSAITGFTNVAGTVGLPALGGVVVVVLAWRRHQWFPLILGLSAAGGCLLMTVAGKELFGRDRPPRSDAVPPYETSPSFPSGHTLNATVVVGVIAYLLIVRQSRRVTRVLTVTCAAVLALAVGLSRVYLGHHWLTDVLAAWLLALAWLAIVITADRLWLRLQDDDQQDGQTNTMAQ